MRKFFVIILAILSFTCLSAQMIVKSQNQTLIEEAIGKGMYVFVQSYQLEDTTTHNRFGRFGNNHFGSKASLAIRTTEGDIVNADVLTPWNKDINFNKYKGTYKPVVSDSKIIEFGDTIASSVTVCSDTVIPGANISAIFVSDSVSGGFKCQKFVGSTEGWIVWVSNDSIIDRYEGSKMPELTIYKQVVDFHAGDEYGKISEPNIPQQVWGGIFIVPKQTAIGELSFMLAGVIVKDDQDKDWIIASPLNDKTEVDAVQGDELTPLTETPEKGKTKEKNKKKR